MSDVIGHVRARGLRTGRGFLWFVGLVVGALLVAPLAPTTPLAQADPPIFDGKEIKDLCTISASGQSCPVFPPPPGLLNSGAVAAAGPEGAAALRRLEDKAIANTLADHQLPASDHDAALTWARSDSQLALWGLIAEAIETPAGERTADQQLAVDWMTQLDSVQPQEAALQAGAEYATWAGLDVNQYWWMARTATETELTNFLGQDVRTYDPQNKPRGGYCRYTPPAPYTSTDYDGSLSPNCFSACTSILGCPIPTPTYDDFVDWGRTVSLAGATNDALTAQAINIGLAAGFAAVAVGTALAAALSSAIVSAIGASIWVFAFGTAAVTSAAAAASSAAVATAIAAGATAAEASAAGAAASASTAANFVPGVAAGGAAGAAIAGAVLVVILAIVIAVLEGIRVFDNAALPGKIAQLVVGSRDARTDPATLMATTDGQKTLFYLFVGATMPLPRTGESCDNSRIPPNAWTSSYDPNVLLYVPLGSNTVMAYPLDRNPCLNPPPIPPAAPTDAHFLVSPQGAPAGQPAQASPTISMGGAPVRLHGNWFIIGNGSAGQQTLRLQYVDWEGDTQFAWLYHDAAGYHFMGASFDDDTTTIDSDTCQDDGTCWKSDEIQYIGSDGTGYSATVEEFQSSTGQPSYAPSQPVEASPVTFDAEDFAPGSSDGNLTYTWRFQHLGCGWIECVRTDQGVPAPPSYSDPVAGKTATHTWESIGPAKVELTATDQHGHSATTVFVVHVGNVAPHVTALHHNEASVGVPVTLQGVLGDAGLRDDLNISINYGDGHEGTTKVGENSIPLLDPALTRLKLPGTDWSLLATHTYTQPGIYYGTIAVSDWGGGTDSDTFTVEVTGAQQITFPAVGDQTYGDELTPATGSMLSGVPVTYDADPGSVCQATGDGQAVQLVGVGECTVTAHQVADPPMFLAASPVARTFDVTPAPLTIKAQFEDKVYGADNPVFTATYTRLVNGDTPDDITGLHFDGPPAGADVGDYAITPSGGSNPNYDISYVPGTLRIKRAELVVVVLDQTRSYGADNPVFTWTFNGLVNGDTRDDITGVVLDEGPPVDADVGEYFIDASGASNPNYDIFYSKGTVTITPAPLTITAGDRTRVYGEGAPAAYTVSYDGFVLGDDEDDVSGLTIEGGAPAGADVGSYPILVSGASIPNYAIDFVTGTEHVTPAPLTITADDKSKVYGAKDPAFTASYDGLVNGDTKADVSGLTLSGPPSGSGVGTYAITPSGASNSNYDIGYAGGTETITPAPLTIRPADVAVASGQAPTYSWHGDGWVNGDSDATLSQPGRTPPTCTATVGAPGEYAAAVTCSGASDANYSIGYTAADLRVDPVLSLAQRGLPDDVRQKVYLDGSSASLPVVALDVRFGSRHSYRFPTVLLGEAGRTYVTAAERFDGPVVANVGVTARYLTMHQVLRRAEASGRIGEKQAARLDRRWDDIQALIDPRRNAKLQTALHRFADEVRDQTGASIRAAVAEDLLTYARAVYRRIGGSGRV